MRLQRSSKRQVCTARSLSCGLLVFTVVGFAVGFLFTSRHKVGFPVAVVGRRKAVDETSHLIEADSSPCNIPQIDSKRMSEGEVAAVLVNQTSPLRILNLASSWPAVAKWKQRESFLALRGEIPVYAGRGAQLVR